MSGSEDTDPKPKLTIAVVEQTHANQIPEKVDSDLYETTVPESLMTEFAAAPDGELAAALRRHGFDV
jgi:hypothetical protein